MTSKYGQSASPANSEWLTRRKLIDPQLASSGWKVVPFDPNKSLTAFDRCAIVEVKKLSLGPQNVLTQAERYSRGASQTVELLSTGVDIPDLEFIRLIEGEEGVEVLNE